MDYSIFVRILGDINCDEGWKRFLNIIEALKSGWLMIGSLKRKRKENPMKCPKCNSEGVLVPYMIGGDDWFCRTCKDSILLMPKISTTVGKISIEGGPQTIPRNFKKGDKVKCIDCNSTPFQPDTIYTVSELVIAIHGDYLIVNSSTGGWNLDRFELVELKN